MERTIENYPQNFPRVLLTLLPFYFRCAKVEGRSSVIKTSCRMKLFKPNHHKVTATTACYQNKRINTGPQ